MTIQTEIKRIKTNMDNVWEILEEKGADIPETKNTNTVGECIDTYNRPDYRAIGNELRLAKGYTNIIKGAGKLLFVSSDNKTSSPIDYTDFFGMWGQNAIIDGKRYILSSSGDNVILTQSGSSSDYVDFTYDFHKIDDKLYFGSNEIGPYVNFQIDYVFNTTSDAGAFFINDGKLYYATDKNGTYELIDDTGEWTRIVNAITAIKDNLIFRINSRSKTVEQMSDVTVSGELVSGNYYIVGNKMYSMGDEEVCSLPKNAKKLCGDNFVELVDGSIYAISYDFMSGKKSPSKINIEPENIRQIVYIYGVDGAMSDGLPAIIDTNGKFWYLDYNEWEGVSDIVEKFTDSLGSIESVYVGQHTPRTIGVNYLPCIMDANTEVKTHRYVCRVDSNKAYKNVDSHIDIETIESSTNSSITISGVTYDRNTDIDSVFNFIPDELANYPFSDQELCRAYLSAGIKTQK